MSLILDNTGAGVVVLKAPASGSSTLTFPGTTGTTGQALILAGDGSLTWGSAGATTLTGLTDVAISAPADGEVLRYNSGSGKWENIALTASDVGAQPLDDTLTALSGYNSDGFVVQTATDTFMGRSIVGTAGNISVANGDGVAGNPTLDLVNTGSPVSASFVKITTDAKGRVSGTTAVIASDITALVNSTYVAKAGDTMTGFLTLNADPTAALHAVTKQYVDNALTGLAWKQAVVVATTANVDLGTGGLLTVDGVSLSDGQRVLVFSQTDPTENGIYIAHSGAWLRSSDFDTPAEINGAAVYVKQGSVYGDTGWTVTSEVTTVGTDNIIFAQFSGSGSVNAGSGLTQSGNTISVGTASTSRIVVNSDDIDLATVGSAMSGVNLIDVDVYGRVVAGTTQSYLTGNETITLSGDATGSGTTSIAVTLATVNGSPQSNQFRKITVNGKGLVTATSAVTQSDVETALGYTPVQTTRTITAGTGLSGGGDLSTNRTISLADTAVSAGSYGDSTNVATFTVDAQGRLTAASSVAIDYPVSSVNSQTGAVVLSASDVGAVANAGGAPSIREDVNANRGAGDSVDTGQLFLATDTKALYRSLGTPTGGDTGNGWDIISNASAAGTVTSVNLTAPSEGITVSGGPVTTSGSITLTLADDLAAVEGLTTNGIAARTADSTWTTRSITGTAGNIVITDGDGVAGDPTIDLEDAGTPVSASFVKVTTDTKGRVTATTPVIASDITTLVDSTYVNVAGDTMTGNLVIQTGSHITLSDAPVSGTDAANKNYVDAAIAGLNWKNAVVVATTADITLSGTQTIDGVAVVAGNRVLVKNQTASEENGIYVVAAGAWARSTDLDQAAEFYGATVLVESGTLNSFTAWTQTATVTTVGTDAVTFVQFNGAAGVVAGVGLTLTGNTLDVNLGAGIAQLPTDEVGVDLWAGTANALILTTDGSSTSTATGAQLYLKLAAGSTGGLTQTGDALSLDINSLTAKGSIAAADKIAIYDVAGTANKTATASDVLTYVKANLGAITVSSLTDSGLTSGRVTFAGTGGLLSDSANLTFSGSTLVVGQQVSIANVSSNTVISDINGGSISLTSNVGAALKRSGLSSYSGEYLLQAATTNATQTTMFLDGSSAVLPLSLNSTNKFQIHVVGRDATNDDHAAWTFDGVHFNGATAGSSTIAGSVMETIVAKTTGAASWVATVVADTTAGTISVKVTGAAATNITWIAFVRTVEVK